mmetsp:Transcript_13900/g.41502  ORF Transcript_13900/g.41502 Transcript_13900/m.41502 type:complete len:212 (-) Transcript_13900:14-649(-)
MSGGNCLSELLCQWERPVGPQSARHVARRRSGPRQQETQVLGDEKRVLPARGDLEHGGAQEAPRRGRGALRSGWGKAPGGHPLVRTGEGPPAPSLPDLLLRAAPGLRPGRGGRRLGALRLHGPGRGVRRDSGGRRLAREAAAGPREGVPHGSGRRKLWEQGGVDRRRDCEGRQGSRVGGTGREACALPSDTCRSLGRPGEHSLCRPAEEAS